MGNLKYYFAATCGIVGAVWGKLGALGPILAVLVLANIGDYVTGMWASALESKLSSEKGRKGIFRKIGYWIGIATAFGVDVLLIYAAPYLGVDMFTFPILCPAVAVWLDLNELLSIIENLGRIGVPLPSFFVKTVGALRDGVASGDKMKAVEQIVGDIADAGEGTDTGTSADTDTAAAQPKDDNGEQPAQEDGEGHGA